MMSSSEAINYFEKLVGVISVFSCEKNKWKLRGVLFTVETEETNRIQLFHLDHNAPCLIQRDDQRSRKKT